MQLPGDACYRTASDLDFFRGEAGTVDRPDLLDDADPKTVIPPKWKAFADVGLVEAMSRERWGASKFVRNQLRIWAFNPIDERGEPEQGIEVPHHKFMEVIDKLWGKEFNDDIESKLAILKRSCVIVITSDWVYWRAATEEAITVKRIKKGDKTDGLTKLVNPRYGSVVKAWQEGNLDLPDDYEEQLSWEEAWMNAVMSQGALEIPRLTPRASASIDETRLLPDGTPLSQQPPAPRALSIAPAGVNHEYHIPVPAVGVGARCREKFRFGGKKGPSMSASSSYNPNPSSSSASALGAVGGRSLDTASLGVDGNAGFAKDKDDHSPQRLDSDDEMLASVIPSPRPAKSASASAPAGSPTPAMKRVKVEPSAPSMSSRTAKAERVEALRKQLEDAQKAMDTSTPTTPVKGEPAPEQFGSPFRQIVDALVKETSGKPMEIEDSP